jgi:hypothetical protein
MRGIKGLFSPAKESVFTINQLSLFADNMPDEFWIWKQLLGFHTMNKTAFVSP